MRMGAHEACVEMLKRKGRGWVRKGIGKRDVCAVSSQFLREVAVEHPKAYLKMLRISEMQFMATH